MKSKPVVSKFKKTEWGKLFDERYGKKGHIYNEMMGGV